MRNEIVVLSSAGSQDVAHRISTALVEARAAACVNIVPGVRSIYRWQGKVCDEQEWLLVIKCTAGNLEAVRQIIRKLHTYELPETIAFEITGGDPEYLRWIEAGCESVK